MADPGTGQVKITLMISVQSLLVTENRKDGSEIKSSVYFKKYRMGRQMKRIRHSLG